MKQYCNEQKEKEFVTFDLCLEFWKLYSISS